MAFYEVIIQASQVILVEADSKDEALEVGCENYSCMNFEFDEGRIGGKFEEHPGYDIGTTLYKQGETK